MKTGVREQMANFLLKYGVITALLILVVLFSLTTEAFFTVDNLFDILRAVSILTIVAIGVTFSVVVNGIDVSVGAVTGLAVILSTALMVIWQFPWYWAVVICLLAGAVIGLLNSFLILKLRIPDLLATLGTLYLVQGLQMWITKGDAVYKGMTNPWSPTREIAKGFVPKSFLMLGQGYVLRFGNFRGVPVPVLVMLIVALVAWFLLEYTRFGRAFYAVGGNAEAARLAGIPVKRYRTMAYVISALLATLGGLVLASRIGSGAVKAGDPYLLDAVASTYFGFAVLGVRRPNVWGTVLGAIFVGVMLNGLTMLNVPWYIQDVVKGLVLISALGVSFAIRKESR
ncbi:MAG: simple sugar transport system permease protein [Thermotogota bacterium]|nr:simple sugar transport system permease protein [Thermotogota bacterium]MDK2865009.1 simple sugar transport system permease protein [Thermotogota bacterium]